MRLCWDEFLRDGDCWMFEMLYDDEYGLVEEECCELVWLVVDIVIDVCVYFEVMMNVVSGMSLDVVLFIVLLVVS